MRGQAGIRRAYRPDTLVRLAALKDRYDPGNLVHRNHNIRPTVRGSADQSLGEPPGSCRPSREGRT